MENDRVEGAGGEVPAGTKPLRMQYYDSRGVYRVLETHIDESSWTGMRESPGFSQRFTCTFADGGDTIVGQWELRRDDVHWVDDLAITYRRQKSA